MKYFDRYIDALKGLIKINSVESDYIDKMPFGKGVYDALLYTLNVATELGFRTYNGDGYYGYAEIGEGAEMVGILGHLDTVPIGNDWTVPALEGAVIDGEICGRGVLDDKGPILSTLFAVKELLDEGKLPNKRIRIIFGCDEESGWQCIDRYVEREEIPDIAFTPDADFPVINCEKGVAYYSVNMPKLLYIDSIHGGDRPNMVMDYVEAVINDNSILAALADCSDIEINGNKVSAHGISAHGSTPQQGANAMWKLLSALSTADNDWASKLYSIIANTDGSGYGIACNDEISGSLTINVGTVESDSDSITISLDIRHPISVTREELFQKLLSTFDGWHVEKGFFHNPLYVPADHPLCKSLLEAYTEVTGDMAKPITIGGGTYARALPTALAFGPIFPGMTSTIHQKDERAKLSDLEKMYEIYKTAISKLAF